MDRESKDYVNNRKRCACLRRMSSDDLKEYCAGNKNLADLMEKYDALGRLSIRLRWQCTPLCLLTVDTTIYDIENEGEMSFTKLLDAVAAEDGAWYIPTFVKTALGGLEGIPGLSDEQKQELKDYETCLNCSKSLLSTPVGSGSCILGRKLRGRVIALASTGLIVQA